MSNDENGKLGTRTAALLMNRFRPIHQIARGGMGRVLLVQEILSSRFVVIKIMEDQSLASEPLVQQFVREAVITARLQHPNIIPVYELGFLTDKSLFYSMRYVEGASYAQVRTQISLGKRLGILRAAARAIDYAHSLHLWHRDVKPDNILVGKHGDVYVIDWGLVSVQPGKRYCLNLPLVVLEAGAFPVPHDIDHLLEQTPEAIMVSAGGKILGTMQYMSPEQASGQDELAGRQSDVWAFGVMLFEALTGSHPYMPDSHAGDPRTFVGAMNAPIPRVRDRWPHAPEPLARLADVMLEKDPGRRLGCLSEFIKTLARFENAPTLPAELTVCPPAMTTLLEPCPAPPPPAPPHPGGEPSNLSLQIKKNQIRVEGLDLDQTMSLLREILPSVLAAE